MTPRACAAAIVLTVISASSTRADEGGHWVKYAPLQIARQEHGAARIGDMVYVVGGLLADFTATDTVEVYDIRNDQWEFLRPMPAGLDHMGVAAVGADLYVMGGYSGDFNARAAVYVYETDTVRWSEAAAIPQPRGACWAVAHRGKIYLFGGMNAADVPQRTTYIYDPQTNQWSQGADMPTAREHLTAVSAGDYIYVIGGRAGGARNANERYDPVADEWTTLAPLPTARSATGTAAFGRRIYVMGGEVPRLFDVNEVYDIVSNTWDCDADMALARHGLAAVTLDDRIFTPGGGTIQGLRPTTFVDAFTPPPATNGDANSFALVTGAHLDGALPDLFHSDDERVHTRSGFGRTIVDLHHMEMTVDALTALDSPTSMSVTVESSIDHSSGRQEMRLLNHATGEFDLIDSRAIGMKEDSLTIDGIDAADYVGAGGEIAVSIKHIVHVPFLAFTFESFIDQVQILIE